MQSVSVCHEKDIHSRKFTGCWKMLKIRLGEPGGLLIALSWLKLSHSFAALTSNRPWRLPCAVLTNEEHLIVFLFFSYHKSTTFWGTFQVFLSNWEGRWSALAQWPVSALQNWALPALILTDMVKSIKSRFYLPNVEWLGHCPEKWLHFCNNSVKKSKWTLQNHSFNDSHAIHTF